jgi:hypothetical protein
MSRPQGNALTFVLGGAVATTVGMMIGWVWLLTGWSLTGRPNTGGRRAATIAVRAVLLAAVYWALLRSGVVFGVGLAAGLLGGAAGWWAFFARSGTRSAPAW